MILKTIFPTHKDSDNKTSVYHTLAYLIIVQHAAPSEARQNI